MSYQPNGNVNRCKWTAQLRGLSLVPLTLLTIVSALYTKWIPISTSDVNTTNWFRNFVYTPLSDSTCLDSHQMSLLERTEGTCTMMSNASWLMAAWWPHSVISMKTLPYRIFKGHRHDMLSLNLGCLIGSDLSLHIRTIFNRFIINHCHTFSGNKERRLKLEIIW